MSDSPWFKFYASDWLAGTRGMSAAEMGVFITLLAMMYDEGKPVRDDEARLARRCGITPATFRKIRLTLIEEGKIVIHDGGLWNERARVEIENREKVSESARGTANRRWDKKQAKTKVDECEGNAKAMRNACYPEPEPEYRYPPPSEAPPQQADEAADAFDAYNAAAAAVGWPKATALNVTRRASLKARVREAGGIVAWRAALARARASPFLTGQNDRGWLPDLDFFLQAKSFTRLIEGAYDRRTPPQRSHHAPRGVDYSAAVDQVFGGRDGADRDDVASPADDRGGPILDFASAGRGYLLA